MLPSGCLRWRFTPAPAGSELIGATSSRRRWAGSHPSTRPDGRSSLAPGLGEVAVRPWPRTGKVTKERMARACLGAWGQAGAEAGAARARRGTHGAGRVAFAAWPFERPDGGKGLCGHGFGPSRANLARAVGTPSAGVPSGIATVAGRGVCFLRNGRTLQQPGFTGGLWGGPSSTSGRNLSCAQALGFEEWTQGSR